MSAAYSTLLNEDLETLFKGFATQAQAMAVMFASSAGLISDADEHAAQALAAAAAAPTPISSPGMFGSLTSGMTIDTDSALPMLAHFSRVGPQPTDGLDLDTLGTAANALSPSDYYDAAHTLSTAATTLDLATGHLVDGLTRILDTTWLGHTATAALSTVRSFRDSAHALVTDLNTARDGAQAFGQAATVTQNRIAEQVTTADQAAHDADTAHAGRGLARTVWQALTPTDELTAAIHAGRDAARDQAAHVIHTEYNPGLGDGDLANRSFTTAYQVITGDPATAAGGIGTFDWNTHGTAQSAPVVTGGWEQTAGANPAIPGDTAAGTAAGTGHPGGTTSGAGASTGTRAADAATTGVGAPRDADTTTAVNTTDRAAAAGADTSRASAANPATTAASTNGTGAGGMAGMAAPIGGAAGLAGGGARSGAGSSSRTDRRATGYDSATSGLGGTAALAGAGTLAGLGAGGLGNGNGSGTGTGAGAGLRGTSPMATPATPGTASSAAGRPSMTGAGMMHGAHGQHGERKSGHKPASYLVHATNTNEIIGDLPKVSPAVLGAPPRTPDPGET